MRSIRLSVVGAAMAVGMIAAVACESSAGAGQELVSGRAPSPEFSIQVADAVGGGTLELSEFRLADHVGQPLVIYFSFVG